MREQDIQRDIRRYLENTGWLVVKCQPGSWLPPGAPDVLAVHPSLPPLWIEVKSRRGRLSDLQRACHERFVKRGFDVLTVKSVDEVREFLRK